MTEEYPPIPESFRLYFYTLGDINRDGKINIVDLTKVTREFGKADTEADINGDGVVNIIDVSIVARNQGKDIETEWHKTVDKERLEEERALKFGVPNVPWYIEWAREVARLNAQNDQAYATWLDPAMQSFMDNLKALTDLPDTFWKGNIQNADDLLTAQIGASHKVSMLALNDALSASPSEEFTDEWGLNEALGKKLLAELGIPMGRLPVERFKEAANAAKTLSTMQQDILNMRVRVSVLDSVNKSLSFGSVDLVERMQSLLSSAYGWDTVGSLATTLPINAAVIEPARQYYNSVFFPNIPGVSDLVRMLSNGKITEEAYAEIMALNGWDEYWQANFWQAHWTKPSIGDSLTAWRRGVITDEQLNMLMVNADLDPAWRDIWEQRKFNDLSVGAVHELEELFLVNDAELFDYVKRNGYNLKDTALTIQGMKAFPVRRLKLRYLLTLTLGVSSGLLERAEVQAGVNKLGYADVVTDWIMNVGELKRDLTKRRVKVVREKLLGVADLKRAYVRGLITEDALRTELLTRGYPIDEAQLLIDLLNEDKGVLEAGGKVRGLSVTELLDSWRYSIITEDDLRNRLLARGMELADIDVLLATKRAQWKMVEAPLPELPHGVVTG